MNIEQLLELFFAMKADKKNFVFDLSKNYPTIFYQMICEYQKLSEESKENFGVLDEVSNFIEQKTKYKEPYQKNNFSKEIFKKSVSKLLSDNRYKITNNKETGDFSVYANAEYIEEVINNSTHKERIDMKEVIWFYDKVDMIINNKVTDVKHR
jgi:hypothetical protein